MAQYTFLASVPSLFIPIDNFFFFCEPSWWSCGVVTPFPTFYVLTSRLLVFKFIFKVMSPLLICILFIFSIFGEYESCHSINCHPLFFLVCCITGGVGGFELTTSYNRDALTAYYLSNLFH